jgi:hypothetical protein
MTSDPTGSDEIVNWIIHVTCPSQGPQSAQRIAMFFPQRFAVAQKALSNPAPSFRRQCWNVNIVNASDCPAPCYMTVCESPLEMQRLVCETALIRFNIFTLLHWIKIQ